MRSPRKSSLRASLLGLSSNPPLPAERVAEKASVTPEFDHQDWQGASVYFPSQQLSSDVDRNLSHAQTIHLPYEEWAEDYIARIKGVLDGARAEHTQAVKDHIDEVGQMKDVVSLTEGQFQRSELFPLPPLLITHRLWPLCYRRLHSSTDAFVRRQQVVLVSCQVCLPCHTTILLSDINRSLALVGEWTVPISRSPASSQQRWTPTANDGDGDGR